MSAIGSSYSECPIEVREAIVDQLCPKAGASEEELQRCARDLAALSATDKRISPYCQKKLKELKPQLIQTRVKTIFPKWATIENLESSIEVLSQISDPDFEPYCKKEIERINHAIEQINKYSKGNERYHAIHFTVFMRNKRISTRATNGTPQLIQIFASFLPILWDPSFRKSNTNYNDCEDDIVRIIDVLPDSLHCKMGHLRQFRVCSPLVFASLGYLYEKVPLYIIEYLLAKGADPNDTIENIHNVSLLRHLNNRYYSNISTELIITLRNLLEKYGARSFVIQHLDINIDNDDPYTGDPGNLY